MGEVTRIEDTLSQRVKIYGDFSGHSAIATRLKDVVRDHGTRLAPLHREALDMIMHKVGRILNGDPNYADSWHDIAGYATLVEQRLPEKK